MSTDTLVLHDGLVVTPQGVLTGHDVLIEDGRIAAVVAAGRLVGHPGRLDVAGALIAPGLIDLHTHGALGRSFGEPDAEAYDIILRFLAAHGVTRAQASLLTADFDAMVSQLGWAADYRAPDDAAALHGLHLEGPYLSADDQARGAADPRFLRTPQPGDAERLLRHPGVMTMMTIAPELPGALELIGKLAAHDVVVAVGHSSAERDAFDAAVAAGARHITHLWSGMSNVLRREHGERVPGLIECSLASDELTGEVIADGHHLPATLLAIARRCLGGSYERLCVVSDSIIGAGLPEGYRYGPPDQLVEVHGGVARLVGQDRFAGSVTPLNGMVRHLVALGWPLHEVITMASTVPARVLRLGDRKGMIKPGYDADLALFDRDFTCRGTLIGGSWAVEPTPPQNQQASRSNTGAQPREIV